MNDDIRSGGRADVRAEREFVSANILRVRACAVDWSAVEHRVRAMPEPSMTGLVGWTRDVLHSPNAPQRHAFVAGEVVAALAMDFDRVEAMVTGREPDGRARQRWRAARQCEQPNPDRSTWQTVDGLWVKPLVWGPTRTFDEWDNEVARLDEERNERTRAMMRATKTERKPLTADERRRAGEMAGGRVSGASVKAVPCPKCQRRSVWWYVDPGGHTWTGAACKHRESCGWAGPIRHIVEIGNG